MKHIKRAFYYASITAFALLLTQSCVKDEVDFDKLSHQIEYNPDLYAPLVKGSMTFRDFYKNDSEDTVVFFDGDSIYLLFKLDSILNLNVPDFVDIPDQETQNYHMETPIDVIYPFDDTYILEQVEDLDLTFESAVKLDSVFTNTGVLRLEITSTYSSEGRFELTSPNLKLHGQPIDTSFQFSRASGDYHMIHDISLQDAALIIDNSNPDTSKFNVTLRVVVEVTGPDTIEAGSFADINISVIGLDDFEAIFGDIGDTTFTADTILDTDLGDIIQGLSGIFAITNPKISMNYKNSFGLPIGFDVRIKGIFDEGDSVVLLPGMQVLEASPDYRNPEVNGVITFGRSNIPNIDQFLVFPPPVQIGTNATVKANPPGYASGSNYVLGDSRLDVDMRIEVPLEFRADLELRDTVKIDLGDDELTDSKYIEFARLHYKIRNEFPINIDGYVILYDSINNISYDTIQFNDLTDHLFIEAAPVDADGITMMGQVVEIPGVIDLSRSEIDHLFNEANKLIIVGKLSSYNPSTVSSVAILDYYKLNFRFNLETKVYYRGTLD